MCATAADLSCDDAVSAAEELRAQGLHGDALVLLEPCLAGSAGRRAYILYADLLIELGRAEDAIAHLEKAVNLFGDCAPLWLRLGRALSLGKQPDAAIDALREAAALDPGSRETIIALGLARQHADDLPRAIGDFERVLRDNPDDVEAHFRLGECWALLDEHERAARAYGRALALDPSDRLGAAIRLAEISARSAPQRASRSYVKHLFDGYAPRYDAHMRQALSYRGPEVLLELAQRYWTGGVGFEMMADLGCGSGLSGAIFRPFTRRLVGVDLSPRMAGLAEATGHYDAVYTDDIVDWLARTPDRFDAMIACDVVIYFGALDPLFAAAAARLNPGGWLFLSTEKADDHVSGGFEIGPSRRFRHTAAYLNAVAAANHFDICERNEAILRFERRAPVLSYVLALRRRGNDTE